MTGDRIGRTTDLSPWAVHEMTHRCSPSHLARLSAREPGLQLLHPLGDRLIRLPSTGTRQSLAFVASGESRMRDMLL